MHRKQQTVSIGNSSVVKLNDVIMVTITITGTSRRLSFTLMQKNLEGIAIVKIPSKMTMQGDETSLAWLFAELSEL